ncbi:hypothetical protein METBIDRAFT_10504 [Metschnikowia bicuspidata var. bicuspidata NRRL YB-4993]|uniref:Uncharacterized protein n=1 Tax=Metschnikowia bicuspidata var. bicuspidata NRRL YB-4993 TaxID=869754 RepID=A0A1A0HJL7_9ASCO|nr:hypothetical protein METBIDRAFT_10504 [Metschnikowia bicuspidata var. bicuspidata NRRL YB-4993]OBA24359.1 hypothetical protein METBIDRAFT_10504 [Metschnikowia bicuspidata var. bicuspidata NRRL YB-4993]
MVKLSTAPLDFGVPSRRPAQQVESPKLDVTETLQTSHDLSSKIPLLELKDMHDSLRRPVCPFLPMGDCEGEIRQLQDENLHLSTTVCQLKKTISEYEAQVQSLLGENKRLQESLVSSRHSPPNKFDKRLGEIEQVLAHGLTHTLNALQSIRDGKQQHTQILENTAGSKNHVCHTEEESLSVNLGHGPLIAASQESSLQVPNEGVSNSLEILTNSEHAETRMEKPHNPLKVPKANRRNIEVKRENSDESASRRTGPGVFDSSKSKARSTEENFDDITFFMKPSASRTRHALRLNDRLSKTRKAEQPSNLASNNPIHGNSSTQPHGVKVEQEHQDENAHVLIKQESSKKRKALEPLATSSNRRPSIAARMKNKVQHDAFEFVDKSTLLEQSRKSLKKSLG